MRTVTVSFNLVILLATLTLLSVAHAQDEGGVVYQNGFRMYSGEDYALQVSGHVRTDFHYIDYPTDSPFIGELVQRFDLSQASINIDAMLMEYYQASIGFIFGNQSRLTNGYINLNFWPNAQFRFGQFGYPFGSEDLSSSTYAAFLQTTTISNAVAGVTAVGAIMSGNPLEGLFHYQVGFLREQNSFINDNLDFVTRLVTYPTQPFSDFFHTWLGVSFLFGENVGIENEDIYLTTESGFNTPLLIADFPTGLIYSRLKLGLEATILIGPFMLKGEYLNSQITFDESFSISGGYVTSTIFLTGEQRAVFSGLLTRQGINSPFDPALDQWGALELAARYSWINVDENLFQPASLYPDWPGVSRVNNTGSASAWTVGLNWYLHPMVTMMFNVVATLSRPAISVESQFSEYAFMSGVHMEF